MTDQNFTTTIEIDRPEHEVFDAITDPRSWWSDSIDGRADRIGSEFVFDGGDHHCWRFRVVELEPARRVVWRVFNSMTGFVDDRTEWDDTEVHFDLSAHDKGTRLCFTHVGLTPALECFDGCSTGWTGYITASLPNLVTTGRGHQGRY